MSTTPAVSSVKPKRLRRRFWWLSRLERRLFGMDRLWHWRILWKSKLLRARCILLGGHRHEWMKLHGGGAGHDALMCKRCRCHIKEYRATQL